VVVENVERTSGWERSRSDAAYVAARELVGPIVALTITLAACTRRRIQGVSPAR